MRATPFEWWPGFRSRGSARTPWQRTPWQRTPWPRTPWQRAPLAPVVVLAVLLALLSRGAALGAQSIALPGNTGRLEGLVTDTLGQPLAGVTVLLASVRRTARTREDGTFRFDDLPAGPVRATTRAVGYIAAGVDAMITVGGTTRIEFRMLRLAASLPTMTTNAARPGLTGVVGDTAYRAIEGALVKALGKSMNRLTDSLGVFHMPLAPGSYLLRLDRKGYATQMAGVHIPDDSGKRIAVWMTPAGPNDGVEIMRQVNLFNLEQRMIRATSRTFRTFSREALQRYGSPDLANAVSRSTAQRVDFDACAAINGGPAWAPLWSIDVDEVEFLEANLLEPSRMAGSRGRTSLNGMQSRGPLPTGMELSPNAGGCKYVAWLRK